MNNSFLGLSVAVVFLFLSGCTSINVRPVSSVDSLQHVCIEENPKVIIDEFVPILRKGFDRHGISTEVYSGLAPEQCETILTYTALRSWDFAPYLSHAELNLNKNGQSIASAEYHLRGKGGFSLFKWQGVEKKMTPVIDELLEKYQPVY